MVKRLSAMWETWVRSLGREAPLEKEMQPTPVLLPGKSHGLRSLVGYSLRDRKSLTRLSDFLSFSYIFSQPHGPPQFHTCHHHFIFIVSFHNACLSLPLDTNLLETLGKC